MERLKVEAGLGRKLGNSVACEGKNRVERCEVFGKWRARMSMAGFELKPMSQNVAESMRSRLSYGNRVNPGFTVKGRKRRRLFWLDGSNSHRRICLALTSLTLSFLFFFLI
ncbi:hypothetical protein Patl1_20187 [Pistacia atlantica]|uniref:Uncharacterized protein n=1 Tax=Pistacia atlantica TaxID=434234 RepID=A0ACC1BM50_9ROSI|nr:hypothetical protein Patl1_20187 [Pistacia atlantica]